MRALLPLVLLFAASLPAAAGDYVQGPVRSLDRDTNTLVMRDKTVWAIPLTLPIPADLEPGDVVRISYVNQAENGIGPILGVAEIRD